MKLVVLLSLAFASPTFAQEVNLDSCPEGIQEASKSLNDQLRSWQSELAMQATMKDEEAEEDDKGRIIAMMSGRSGQLKQQVQTALYGLMKVCSSLRTIEEILEEKSSK